MSDIEINMQEDIANFLWCFNPYCADMLPEPPGFKEERAALLYMMNNGFMQGSDETAHKARLMRESFIKKVLHLTKEPNPNE